MTSYPAWRRKSSALRRIVLLSSITNPFTGTGADWAATRPPCENQLLFMILAFSDFSLSEIMHGTRQLDKWITLFIGLFFGLFTGAACAQAFPSRPFRIVVPLAAGGTGDTLARLLAEEMAKPLGTPLIVDNRPGSGGIIGTDAVAKSAPDGYTLLHTSSSHVMQPALRPQLPYDAIPDFAVIARTADTHQVLLANPAFPPASVKELLSYAKTQRVFYGSAGHGSAPHPPTGPV